MYGVTPKKRISILYLEVCNFDVRGNEVRIREEEGLVLYAITISWIVVFKRALRHWWCVIVDSSLECGIYAYDVIMYTTHLVPGLVPFGDKKRNWRYFSIQCCPSF